MTHVVRRLVPTFALLMLLVASSSAKAQSFYGGEIERAARPGAYVYRDGMSFSHWYNYDAGPGLFLGMDSGRLWNFYYLDREERAATFGYSQPMARPPLFNRLFDR